MKSTSGEHYVALDHIRALAAFMVFSWHFTHGPISFLYTPGLAPFALLDEGHTGVALFMTLSGYLFAKLLNGKSISYWPFLYNRILRLLPLLFVVLAVEGVRRYVAGGDISLYLREVFQGLWNSTLPNGGWSITVEFHFYLILPLLLWMLRRSKLLPLTVILCALPLRLYLRHKYGEVHVLSYWTIVGRIDQFVLGMVAFHLRSLVTKRHVFFLFSFLLYSGFYWHFDQTGGFYNRPKYPSSSLLWVIMPTIEGLFYAIGIAWYETSFQPVKAGISKFVGLLGEYSYSIYLLHFFFIFRLSPFINEHVMNISNFYVACLWSLICFSLMIVPGFLSFRYIEEPFLRLRRRYIVGTIPAGVNRESATQPLFASGGKLLPLARMRKLFASTWIGLAFVLLLVVCSYANFLSGGSREARFSVMTLYLLLLVCIFFLARRLFVLADGESSFRTQVFALVVAALYGVHPVSAQTINYLCRNSEVSPIGGAGLSATYLPLSLHPFVLFQYFQSFFWPEGLALYSDLSPFNGPLEPRAVFGYVFVLLILAAALRAFRHRSDLPVAFGLLWFVLTFLLLSLTSLTEFVGGYVMFLPLVGLTIAVVWVFGHKALTVKRDLSLSVVLTIGWILMFAGWTFYRNDLWKDTAKLHREAAQKYPNSWRAQMEQGLVYMSKGKNMKALEYFRKARELNPTEYLIEVNFGIALNELDRWTQAERHFMRAIELNPRSSNSYVPFARSLLGRNRVDDASKLLEQALELNLASAEIYRLILPIYLNREEYARTAKVLELAQDLLVTDPQLQFFEKLSKSRTKLAVPYGPRSDDAGGWMNYSLDLYGVGAFEQSIMASTEVLRYQPNSANAYNNIAAAYNNLSQFDLAASAAKRALELGPGFERASGNLKFSETKLAESK